MAAASAIMLQAGQAITASIGNQAITARQEPDGEAIDGEVYNMTSNLFPCICVAMYETVLSPNFFLESMNDGEDQYMYDTLDWQDWKTELVKVSQDYIDSNVIESLKNYGLLKIEACSIWSPKYYNYNQDELVMDVTMQQDWQDTMKEKIEAWRGRQDVIDYIKKYWRSYSGYVNFMPESLDEILTEDDEDRQLAAYLTLAMLVEGTLRPYDEILDELYYSMNDSFCDYERVNLLAEYMDEQEADKLLTLYNNDDDWNDLYWRLVEKIGFVWLHEGPDSLRGKKDSDFEFNAKSDGERLLFWAIEKELTVEELQDMAA
jgi:hypothetical protein